MINRTGFRNLLESQCGGNHLRMETTVRHMLGICDRKGRLYKDAAGNRLLKDPVDSAGKSMPRLKPDEIPMRALNESLLGENQERAVSMVGHAMKVREVMEAEAELGGRTLLEDNAAGAVGPSSFANINAWTGVVTRLLDVGILEAYQNPEYIADEIAPVEMSKQIEGRKTIGAARVGPQAEERLPGMPTKRAQFGDRWLTQPRTVENALAVELLWETVFLDITGGQVSAHANDVGDWLAYTKDLRCIDSFIGTGQVSGASGFNIYVFSYRGTNYNPYTTAGTLYDNFIQSGNELLHEDSIQSGLIKFRDMLDPETGTRVTIKPNTLLVNREKVRTAASVVGPTAQVYQLRDAPGATSGTQQINVSDPYYKGQFQVLESPLVFQRMTDASGLNLATSVAAKVWYMFERGKKTHVYIQNQPLTTVAVAGTGQLDMVDRNVVLFVKAWERGIPMWIDPRRSVQSRA